jgi:putative transposase
VRAKDDFVVAGYVVMPEHFHLLIGEPRVAKFSRAMQVLKQRVSLRCRGDGAAFVITISVNEVR